MKASARHMVTNFGHETSDFARRMGGGTAALARRFGHGTADVARRVGPKRGLIGLAVIGAVVGGIILARYLTRRREQELDYDAAEDPETRATNRMHNLGRDQRSNIESMER